MYTRIYIYEHAHGFKYMHMYVCIHMCIRVYIYILIHRAQNLQWALRTSQRGLASEASRCFPKSTLQLWASVSSFGVAVEELKLPFHNMDIQ